MWGHGNSYSKAPSYQAGGLSSNPTYDLGFFWLNARPLVHQTYFRYQPLLTGKEKESEKGNGHPTPYAVGRDNGNLLLCLSMAYTLSLISGGLQSTLKSALLLMF